ncbi:MAG: ATP synthase F1 subunit delta [Saprospiraceae bacterium]|nr:ATP synthase F1 subunit delta [Saprospiraceae bacterium]
MSVSRISTRYAKSLLDLARDRNELEAVKVDIDNMVQAMKNRDLVLFLKSPIINAGKKLSVFKTLFDGKVGKTTMAFFDIIIKKGREMYLPEICVDFIDQYKFFNRISTVTITTAAPMTEGALNDIKSKLLSSEITMDKLDIVTKVNPDIIGGFVLEVGDKLYDASIIHKLEQVKKEFASNQYVKSF